MSSNNSNSVTMLVGAVAGVITVATSASPHDFSDTIIGIVIGLLMWPLIKSEKSIHSRILLSAISGLCFLLIVGVFVDAVLVESYLNISHFVVWAIASIILYCLFTAIQKKCSKLSNSDGINIDESWGIGNKSR